MAKNILVTGGAGFIGSHLADRLIEDGHRVVVVDNLFTGNKKNINKQAKFYKTDIQHRNIEKIFLKEKPEIVFHYAAQINVRSSVNNPLEDAKINILGSLNILENSKKYGVKKVIFSSSGGTIYGAADVVPTPETAPELPMSPYAISKLSVEKYLKYYHQVFGLGYIALRFANVYGPRQNPKSEAGVISIFCNKILSNTQPMINGTGKQTRDFVFVKDVVEASILAMDSPVTGIFNVGTGKEVNVNAIFSQINMILHTDYKKAYGPAIAGELDRSCLDFSSIKESFGWTPKYDITKGLQETLDWFKRN